VPRVRRIGFVVNPLAGLGGRVGLKGTDGVVDQALAAGAKPVAGLRAEAFVSAFARESEADPRLSVAWLAGGADMGEESLRRAGLPVDQIDVVHVPPKRTTAEDTRRTVDGGLARKAELIVFCGGDGTARDVAAAVMDRVPVLGVPAGVKMHSGVFAVNPAAAADILAAFLRGELREGTGEILDLDEQAYRDGRWTVRLFTTAKTLVEPHLVSAGKMMVDELSEASVRSELAAHFTEVFEANSDTLFVLGPGSTLHGIATSLRIEKTLLGIDAVVAGGVIARDVNEARLLELLDRHRTAKLVVSPIGAQGFILGRGNLPLSPAVLRRIGTANLIVVATPGKLAATPVLRVDTGDPNLDREFREKEYLFVVIGYRTSKLHPIQA
jgi:predicted polyphosphate/ATP-dependent NAD kinase